MTDFQSYQNFIDGRPQSAIDGTTIDVIDPATGLQFGTIPRSKVADIEAAVESSERAYRQVWSKTSATDRGRILHQLSVLILRDKHKLAEEESRDTGKPLKQALADMVTCARYFEYYGGAADKLHGDTIPFVTGTTVLTVRVPHGVTGHIVPWNYPGQIFARSVAAALAAGNSCIVKPAEDACLTPLHFAKLAIEAGLPAGVLNIVCGLGREAGAALAAHPSIAHLSFTGSTTTGAAVAEAAARRHAPATLELGGKSPQVLFADADLEQAIPVILNAIIQNAGQTCAAGSRVLIERSAYEKVMSLLAARFAALKVGPGNEDHDVGPVINRVQQQKIKRLIDQAVDDGAQIVAQGQLTANANTEGSYVLPTLLGSVSPALSIARDEVFGPVLVALSFDTEDEAIELANGTDYGLTAAVWTRDGARQLRMAHAIEAGQVFINNYGAAGGVELPFGGMKKSGYGREKGLEGLIAFTTVKTIVLKHG